MKLYFVRHGESEANTQHVISNRASPFPLTLIGRQQAQALARNLQNVPVTSIFSSPILRARETAEILSAAFDHAYQVTEALREYDCGILEEKSDQESWRLHREIAEDWARHHNYQRKAEGGECFSDIQARFIPFVEGLILNHRNTEAHILLVGHGGLFQLMLPLLLDNVDAEFVRVHEIGHTDYVLAQPRADGMTCLQWGLINFYPE